ncbi:flavin monoamine oxidase family protein [Nocardioides maradonensis]
MPDMDPTPPPVDVEVLVVGAGYAGLTTALELHDAGVDVLVLEAGDRVGGRTLSTVEGGVRIDHGGQWVGPTQHHLLAMADRFGCTTFPTYEDGRSTEIWRDGSRVEYVGAGPDAGPGVAEYERITALLDELAVLVDPASPWTTEHFEEWDRQSAADFFAAATADLDARARLALAIHGVWCTEPEEISILHVLLYLRGAGGYTQLMETRDCAQDRRFHDGADGPARAAARLLGDRVRLGTPVRALRSDGNVVTVTTTSGELTCRRVVVTVPPPAARAIDVTPPLPAAKRAWLEGNAMGRVAKVHVTYATPFWRAADNSGIATIYTPETVGVVFDNSPDDAERGVLVAFVYADRLDVWAKLDDAARREAVIADLAAVMGERARAVVGYVEKNWAEDPIIGGGYEAYPAPGTWSRSGAEGWRRPTGLIHWAGTETADTWNGYIDGAISSGIRAAAEVVASLEQAGDAAQ